MSNGPTRSTGGIALRNLNVLSNLTASAWPLRLFFDALLFIQLEDTGLQSDSRASMVLEHLN